MGRKMTEKIIQLRKAQINITLDMFKSLGIKDYKSLLDLIDFAPWSHPFDEDDDSEDNNPGYASASMLGPTALEDWRSPSDIQDSLHIDPERQEHDAFLERMQSASQRLQGPPKKYNSVSYDTSYMKGGKDATRTRQPYPKSRSQPRRSRDHSMKRDGDLFPEESDEDDLFSTSRKGNNTRTKSHSTQIPKSITFDGKKDWKSFQTKFTMYADEQHWTTREKKQNLCWCLEDKASEFYSRLIARDPDMDFVALLSHLERRFDLKELPESAQMHFSYASQNPKESLVEWADRVVSLALKAYPDMADKHIYRQAILRFCQGCSDNRAGHYAINARPETLEEAVDKVRWFQATEKMMDDRPRRNARSMATLYGSPNDSDNENSQFSVSRALVKPPRKNEEQQTEKKVHFQRDEDLAKRMSKLEMRVDKFDDKFDKLTASIEGLTQVVRKSVPRSRSRSPSRCFHCGREGHFKADCPDLKKEEKKVQALSEDLNDSGSDF